MPAIVTTGGSSGAFTTTRTISTPTLSGWTPAENDMVWLCWNVDSAGATFTLPADWVAPTAFVDTASNSVGTIYHMVTAAEALAATASWTLTNFFDANRTGRRVALVIRNCDPATPIDVTAINNSAAAPVMTIPDITPTKTGSLVFAFGGPDDYQNIGDPAAPWSTVTQVDGGGTTPAFTLVQHSSPSTAGTTFPGATIGLTNNDGSGMIAVAVAAKNPNAGAFFPFL